MYICKFCYVYSISCNVYTISCDVYSISCGVFSITKLYCMVGSITNKVESS